MLTIAVAVPAHAASGIRYIDVGFERTGYDPVSMVATYDITATVSGDSTENVILVSLLFPSSLALTGTAPIPGVTPLVVSTGDTPSEGQVAYFISSTTVNPPGYSAGISVTLHAEAPGTYPLTVYGGSIGFADGIGAMDLVFV